MVCLSVRVEKFNMGTTGHFWQILDITFAGVYSLKLFQLTKLICGEKRQYRKLQSASDICFPKFLCA